MHGEVHCDAVAHILSILVWEELGARVQRVRFWVQARGIGESFKTKIPGGGPRRWGIHRSAHSGQVTDGMARAKRNTNWVAICMGEWGGSTSASAAISGNYAKEF